ncbi:MAG: hypothetical protein ACLFTA_01170 [Candidatus Nanohaloarchaea archaeon]
MEGKLLLILLVILITSGCIDGGEKESPDKGLEIKEFSVTDNQLRPEQNAIITARFKNYHNFIEVNEISIFNEGPHLNVTKRGCTPDVDELEGAREDIYPEMECNWKVQAPPEEDLQGFRQRTEPLKLKASYNASLSSQKPLKVDFKDLEDIENTTTVSKSFSNNELKASMVTESPVAHSSGNSIELSVENAGVGRVEGPYRFEYTPENVFENCPKMERPVSGSSWRNICDLSSGSTGVRNLFFTTYYKYIKEPNLDITVVNRG